MGEWFDIGLGLGVFIIYILCKWLEWKCMKDEWK